MMGRTRMLGSPDPRGMLPIRFTARDNTTTTTPVLIPAEALERYFRWRKLEITLTLAIAPGNPVSSWAVSFNLDRHALTEEALVFPGFYDDQIQNAPSTLESLKFSGTRLIEESDPLLPGASLDAEYRFFWDGYGFGDGVITPTASLRLRLVHDGGTVYIETAPFSAEYNGAEPVDYAVAATVNGETLLMSGRDTVPGSIYFDSAATVAIVPVEWFGYAGIYNTSTGAKLMTHQQPD